MRRFIFIVTVMMALAALTAGAEGARKLRVVATIPDLKSLTEAVGGDLVDRSMGDVHPLGNPHFSLDPGLAPIITQNIVDGLARVEPENRAAFARNRELFLAKLDQEMGRWQKMMEPVRGAKVVVYHPDFIYFLTRFGLVQVATLEDRAGIPASPGHLVNVIKMMKAERVKMILVEPWNDVKLANRVAEEAGARAFVMATAVGAVKGAENYIAAIDFNIKTLSEALK